LGCALLDHAAAAAAAAAPGLLQAAAIVADYEAARQYMER